MSKTDINLIHNLEYLWKYSTDYKEIQETPEESSTRTNIIEKVKQEFLKESKMYFRWIYFDWLQHVSGELRSVDKYYQQEFLDTLDSIIWFSKEDSGKFKFFLNTKGRNNVLTKEDLKDELIPISVFIRPYTYGRFVEILNKYQEVLYEKLQTIHPYSEVDCGSMIRFYIYQLLWIVNIMLGVRPVETIQKEVDTWIDDTVLLTSKYKTKEEQIKYLKDELKAQDVWEEI